MSNIQEMLAGMDIVVMDAPDISAPLTFTTTTHGVNMKNYRTVLACLLITDAATGSVITMKQAATSTVNTALGFTKYWYKADYSSSNAFVEGTAAANTFTTGVASATALYVIPITGDMLDKTADAEDMYVRLNAASAASATGALWYIMGNARFSGDPASLPSIA